MLWLMLPEVAVIVAVYVPAGVPGVVCEDEAPPPHPAHDANASTTSGAARPGSRFRFRRNSHPAPTASAVHARGIAAGGKPTGDSVPVVTGAVVATVTVTVCAVLPICTDELDRLQVGGGVTVGLMPQVRLTLPLNPPTDANERLNVAFCPAEMVCEVGNPDAGPTVKSGAGVPVPETATTCEPVPALSATVRFALAPEAAVGVNVTLIVQLVIG